MKDRRIQGRIMQCLVDRAMRGSETLPAAELAELNEAAALALRPYLPDQSEAAQHTAGLLRQALARQLEFTALLRA